VRGLQDSQIGVLPGDVLAGKYQVERVLGHGGMGVVVAAHHVQLDTKVAIKFLLPDMLKNEEAVARFTREARAAVKITGEHVARVLDVGVLDTGAPYMVMEFLEGGDLAAWLRQRGPLPIEQAVEFVLQACVAVAEAHSLGVIHRDLKPANLFCIRRSDGQLLVKVLDFGISKVVDAGRGSEPRGVSVTATSAVLGSPLYMSPEQMLSAKAADAQSDIWALGVVLYELLSGRVPFEGEAPTEVAVKVALHPPPSLRERRPDVPPGLEGVVLRCLEKDKPRRYRNVAELALALLEFAPQPARALVERITRTIQVAGLSTGAFALAPSPAEPPTVVVAGLAVATSAPVSSEPSIRVPVRHTGILVVAALAGLLVLGGAGVLLVRAAVGHGAARGAAASAPIQSTTATAEQPSPSASAATVASLSSASSAPDGLVASSARPVVAPPVTQAGASMRSAPGSPHPASASHSAGKPQTPPAVQPQGAQPQGQSGSPNCDPPYRLDDEGHKHFKPECYLNR
jgi:serine/threonine-protein kinase